MEVTKCKHVRTQLLRTGSRWFDGFEVRDDFRDDLVCLDCGAVVFEEVDNVEKVDGGEF